MKWNEIPLLFGLFFIMFWWIFEISTQSKCGDDFIESCWEDYAGNIFFLANFYPATSSFHHLTLCCIHYNKKYFEMNIPIMFWMILLGIYISTIAWNFQQFKENVLYKWMVFLYFAWLMWISNCKYLPYK